MKLYVVKDFFLDPLPFLLGCPVSKEKELFIAPGLDVRLKNSFFVQETIDPRPVFAGGYIHSS